MHNPHSPHSPHSPHPSLPPRLHPPSPHTPLVLQVEYSLTSGVYQTRTADDTQRDFANFDEPYRPRRETETRRLVEAAIDALERRQARPPTPLALTLITRSPRSSRSPPSPPSPPLSIADRRLYASKPRRGEGSHDTVEARRHQSATLCRVGHAWGQHLQESLQPTARSAPWDRQDLAGVGNWQGGRQGPSPRPTNSSNPIHRDEGHQQVR